MMKTIFVIADIILLKKGEAPMDEYSVKTISTAIGFIELHLCEKLNLCSVADAVHYSKYYLHRLFTNTVGLTMHDYIQRRKLTEAAKLLVFSNKTLLDISLIAGYESQQAFTNVFTAMYKQSPNKYRENEKFYPLQLKFQFEEEYNMLYGDGSFHWNITYATLQDIPCWMNLVRLVIDGFPHFYEKEYVDVLDSWICIISIFRTSNISHCISWCSRCRNL